MPLLLIFIVIPLIELAVILKVNGFIGIGWTLGLIIITAFVGVRLLKQQGISTLLRANQKMQQGQIPAQELAEGFLLALAGALLLTPGFVTDAFGFILLVPFTRKALVHKVIAFIAPRMMTNSSFQSTNSFEEGSFKDVHSQPESQSNHENITIEGAYTKVDSAKDDK
ncbi:MAG: FxsA family protein [Oleispira sp.]